MEFYAHRLLRPAYAQVFPGESAAFYPLAKAEALARGSVRAHAQISIEESWEAARRPYYLVYPGILPALTRLDLDVDSALIHPPMPQLSIRLPVSNMFRFESLGDLWQVREILLSEIGIIEESGAGGLSMWVDFGESRRLMQGVDIPIHSYRNIRSKPGLTVAQELAELPDDPSAEEGPQMPAELWEDVIRLICTLCLLEKDPSVIAPDVLNKDRDKWEATGDAKFVERAKRRGKVGWRIGHRLEVVPHYRRPHPFRVWTGKGRKVLKVVMRRGSIVHREKVERLPSGFQKEGDGSV